MTKPSRIPANRRAKYAEKHSVTIGVDTASLDALLNELDDDLEAAVRPAAQAGSQVLYDQVNTNVAGLGKVTGNLASAIYQAYSADKSGPLKATYHVSWNASRAPHGHLVEYGYKRRYRVVVDKAGNWKTAIRPEAQGKPKPKRRASQAVKDAYYQTLPTPVHVPGKAFVRSAQSAFGRALDAMENELLQRIAKRGGK